MPEHLLAGAVERAELLYLTVAHPGVAVGFSPAGKPVLLAGAGFDHPFADHGRRLGGLVARELAVLDGGSFDVDIDPVQQWAGDPGAIFFHLARRAPALAGGISEVTARARVHRGDEHEVGWERHRAGRAGDDDIGIFERLAHDLEGRSLELWKLIEKKDAVVRDADLARRGIGGAAEEADVADRVVRGAERAVGNEGIFLVQQPADAVDFCRLDRLVERHRRDDRRDPLGQHALSGSRRTDKQDVVANFAIHGYTSSPNSTSPQEHTVNKLEKQVGNIPSSNNKLKMVTNFTTVPKEKPGKALAYSYIRFSTSEQLHGDSLRRQTEASEKYIKKHGLTLDRSLNLQDLGVSAYRGKNAAEGALAGFFAAIQCGKVSAGSTLVVESLDRLSRDQVIPALTQFLSIINSGVTVVTLMDKMVYSKETINQNPGSLMMSIVVMMRAHDESSSKSDRVAKAWSEKRARAQQNSSPLTARCPAWLTLQKDKTTAKPHEGTYVIIPERAAIVSQIFGWAADGLGKRSIADKLTRQKTEAWGYIKTKPEDRPKDGTKPPRIRCEAWHDSYVLKILNSPAVLGIYQPHKTDPETRKRVPDGEPIPHYFPAVITPQEWQAVHKRRSAPRGPRSIRINNLFSGIVYDGYTCAVMRYTDKSSAGQKRDRGDQRYLQSDVKRTNPGSRGQTWPYWHFEEKVLKFLHELDWASLTNPEVDPEETRLIAEESRLNLEVSQLRNAITRILDTFASATQPQALATAAQNRAADLARNLETAETQLKETSETLEKLAGQTHAVTEGIAEFKALIAAGSPKERIRLQTEIRRRVSKIICYRHGLPIPGNTEPFPDNCIGNPTIQMDFGNGTSRFITFLPTSLSKSRVYDQPRHHKTGAYISRTPRSEN